MAVSGSLTIENDGNSSLNVKSITYYDDVAKHGGLMKGEEIKKGEERTLTISNESLIPPKGVGAKIQLNDMVTDDVIVINFEIPTVGKYTLETLDSKGLSASYSTLSSSSNAYKAKLFKEQ